MDADQDPFDPYSKKIKGHNLKDYLYSHVPGIKIPSGTKVNALCDMAAQVMREARQTSRNNPPRFTETGARKSTRTASSANNQNKAASISSGKKLPAESSNMAPKKPPLTCPSTKGNTSHTSKHRNTSRLDLRDDQTSNIDEIDKATSINTTTAKTPTTFKNKPSKRSSSTRPNPSFRETVTSKHHFAPMDSSDADPKSGIDAIDLGISATDDDVQSDADEADSSPQSVTYKPTVKAKSRPISPKGPIRKQDNPVNSSSKTHPIDNSSKTQHRAGSIAPVAPSSKGAVSFVNINSTSEDSVTAPPSRVIHPVPSITVHNQHPLPSRNIHIHPTNNPVISQPKYSIPVIPHHPLQPDLASQQPRSSHRPNQPGQNHNSPSANKPTKPAANPILSFSQDQCERLSRLVNHRLQRLRLENTADMPQSSTFRMPPIESDTEPPWYTAFCRQAKEQEKNIHSAIPYQLGNWWLPLTDAEVPEQRDYNYELEASSALNSCLVESQDEQPNPTWISLVETLPPPSQQAQEELVGPQQAEQVSQPAATTSFIDVLTHMAAAQHQTLSFLAQAQKQYLLNSSENSTGPATATPQGLSSDALISSPHFSAPNPSNQSQMPSTNSTSPLSPYQMVVAPPPTISLTMAPTNLVSEQETSHVSSSGSVVAPFPFQILKSPSTNISLDSSSATQGTSLSTLESSRPAFQFNSPQAKLDSRTESNPKTSSDGLTATVSYKSPSSHLHLQVMPAASRPIVSPRSSRDSSFKTRTPAVGESHPNPNPTKGTSDVERTNLNKALTPTDPITKSTYTPPPDSVNLNKATKLTNTRTPAIGASHSNPNTTKGIIGCTNTSKALTRMDHNETNPSKEHIAVTQDDSGKKENETFSFAAGTHPIPRNDEGTLKNDKGTLKNDEGTLKNDEGTLKNDEGTLKNDEGTQLSTTKSAYTTPPDNVNLNKATELTNSQAVTSGTTPKTLDQSPVTPRSQLRLDLIQKVIDEPQKSKKGNKPTPTAPVPPETSLKPPSPDVQQPSKSDLDLHNPNVNLSDLNKALDSFVDDKKNPDPYSSK